MPKRTDIKSVMVIGSGPIVIGQAAEFDYSGTQACRVLREEGVRVILVNSNPATIMTDPEMADATYIEPISTPILEKIIAKERPDALLPTLGGQTALNAAVALGEAGVLKKYDVELIGASLEAIDRGEDRESFKKVVEEAGAESARSDIAHTLEEVDAIAERFGFPLVVRPSFTMGGLGSGIAHDTEELHRIAGAGIHYSPTDEVLIEEGIEGWKEYELELMRDRNDNVVVVCPIENVDPVGVHTGDSITVAPVFTLTDREYQKLRDIGIAIIRGVGVDTGGCNIQFAIHPDTGRIIVIEMNPRVSRSSALASKATGFPIAKIATRRDPERHHEVDACQLRAHHRLCGHQGAAVRFREVPRRRSDADHFNEVGGRGHGFGGQLPGVAWQGHALHRQTPYGLQLGRREA